VGKENADDRSRNTGEVESEAGKTLTDNEAGQLIRAARLAGRVFTDHF
jgi:hypothetical protein